MTVRVVLVDDVEDVRRVVRTALRLHGGFQIVGEAPDGVEGVRLAALLKPDVVVLDLGLPDIAGREVLSRIRQQSPASKVVVFSGIDTPDSTWISERVEGFVLKDAEVTYLVDLLHSLGREGAVEASIDLTQEPTSVARARQFLHETLSASSAHHLVDDAALVVSELVTNAITHASSSCILEISLTPAILRVSVIDGGAGSPEPQPASESREHGRGLRLVDAVASAWGMDTVPGDGKVVWAELPCTAAAR